MKTGEIFETLGKILNPELPVMPLAAIWLASPITTSEKTTRRITEGDFVRIEGDELKDCVGKEKPATHRITACMGKATSDFSINVIHLKTLELKTIIL